MAKPLVFISHITEEREVAQALKRLVETAFLNMIEVFVSSDPASIKAGGKWLDEITRALKSCAVEVILVSSESVRRPWINFEAGSGWVRDIPVIPLCHSGMNPGKLPTPLGSLQAVSATDEAGLRRVFPVLAQAIGSDHPRCDFTDFIAVVKKYEDDSRQFKEMTAATSVAGTDGLSQHELASFVEIAELTDAPAEAVSLGAVRSRLAAAGYRSIAFTLALTMLGRKGLVETVTTTDWNGNEFPAVRVTDAGWRWLESNQDKFVLKVQPAPDPDFSDDIPF